jgi:hypothetical protein
MISKQTITITTLVASALVLLTVIVVIVIVVRKDKVSSSLQASSAIQESSQVSCYQPVLIPLPGNDSRVTLGPGQYGIMLGIDTYIGTAQTDNWLTSNELTGPALDTMMNAVFVDSLYTNQPSEERTFVIEDDGSHRYFTVTNISTTSGELGSGLLFHNDSDVVVDFDLYLPIVSDRRLKKNIVRLENQTFCKTGLPMYSYHYVWNSDDSEKHVGVMADEVIAAGYEDCVVTLPNGYYSVLYNGLQGDC